MNILQEGSQIVSFLTEQIDRNDHLTEEKFEQLKSINNQLQQDINKKELDIINDYIIINKNQIQELLLEQKQMEQILDPIYESFIEFQILFYANLKLTILIKKIEQKIIQVQKVNFKQQTINNEFYQDWKQLLNQNELKLQTKIKFKQLNQQIQNQKKLIKKANHFIDMFQTDQQLEQIKYDIIDTDEQIENIDNYILEIEQYIAGLIENVKISKEQQIQLNFCLKDPKRYLKHNN